VNRSFTLRDDDEPVERIAMMSVTRMIGSSVLGLAALVGWPGSARAEEGPEDATQAVHALLDRQTADWNKADLEGFLAGYWNSPKLVFQTGGDRVAGFEAIRQRFRRRYQSEGRAMGQLVFSALEVEPLGPEAAMARGRWRLTMPDGTKPGGLFTVIVRKLPEGWKIVHDHTSAAEVTEPRPKQRPAGE
jgi:beta-aspartyl-peptidase (threonine type)